MRALIVFSICVLISSCAQLTRLDTGKTIGKGNLELGGYIALYGANEEGGLNEGPIALPVLGVQANYGLTEKIDLNASVNSSGNLFFNPKFQIVGDFESPFAVSILPGVDVQVGGFDGSDNPVIVRPHLSAIVSLHKEEWALFLEPKYIYQPIDETNFVGATLGAEYILNDRTKFALGYSYFPVLQKDVASRSSIFNIGLGVKRVIVMR